MDNEIIAPKKEKKPPKPRKVRVGDIWIRSFESVGEKVLKVISVAGSDIRHGYMVFPIEAASFAAKKGAKEKVVCVHAVNEGPEGLFQDGTITTTKGGQRVFHANRIFIAPEYVPAMIDALMKVTNTHFGTNLGAISAEKVAAKKEEHEQSEADRLWDKLHGRRN